MKVTFPKMLTGFFLLLTLVVFCLGLTIFYWLNKPVNLPENFILTLHKGTSLYALAADLRERKIIAHPAIWVQYARLRNLVNIKAGEYQFRAEETPLSLLRHLNFGSVVRYQITFSEGLSWQDFVQKLRRHERIDGSELPHDPQDFLRDSDMDIAHPEGWFFPDTYSYIAGDSAKSILHRAHLRMRQILEEEWRERSANLPLKTPYEALILASIIEKETGAAFERASIAGVFVRRLEKGMRLATDPTVIYGMGARYQGNITRADLQASTPYNTYIIRGLPPTPIAMPGREAIHAALHPAAGDSLYFVAKGDGTHQFSATLEEHNRAVKAYQIKRRKGYRSSPPANAPSNNSEPAGGTQEPVLIDQGAEQ